jgi:general secretion pathway protein H
VIPLVERGEQSGTESDSSQLSLSNVVAQWNGSGIALRFRDSTDREIEIEEVTEVTFYPEGGSTGGSLLFAQAEQSGIIDIDPFNGRVSTRDYEEDL